MKPIILILLFIPFLFQPSFQAATKDKLYDVVIVGGGLSGLSAANELKGYHSLILEKNDHLGGRVSTQNKKGISYDMGAVFRYVNTDNINPGDPAWNYSVEEGGLAINYKGNNFYCDDVMDCVSKLGLDSQELRKIYAFRDNSCSGAPLASYSLSKESYTVLNSLFKMIYPGDIDEYRCVNQKNLFKRWHIEYYPDGNRLVVDTFKKFLSSTIELNAEVISINDEGKEVVTSYRQEGLVKKVFSKAVIVTTPAPITKKLLSHVDPKCLSFLNSVKYGKFTVIAIGLQDVRFKQFSYLFTPDFPSTVIISKYLKDTNTTILLVYYADKSSQELSNEPDHAIIERSIDMIHKLNIGAFSDHNIFFTDIKRWDHGGTIISDEMLQNAFDKDYSHPSKRVFLAGDYVYMKNAHPYGMAPAVKSGKTAAQRVIDLFKTCE